MNIYDYGYKTISGEKVQLNSFKGKAILIVNIASKCGFTPQLEDLEKIYKEYKEQGLEIIGFPCNQFDNQTPEGNKEMNEFCKLNYGVTFNLSEKVEVRGQNCHEVYSYLTKECKFNGFDKSNFADKIIYTITEEKYPEFLIGDSIKWNFTKFLISRDGSEIIRFEPSVEPMDMIEDIKRFII